MIFGPDINVLLRMYYNNFDFSDFLLVQLNFKCIQYFGIWSGLIYKITFPSASVTQVLMSVFFSKQIKLHSECGQHYNVVFHCFILYLLEGLWTQQLSFMEKLFYICTQYYSGDIHRFSSKATMVLQGQEDQGAPSMYSKCLSEYFTIMYLLFLKVLMRVHP